MKITKEELHNLVWSKPLIHISKEYGFSKVGFANICRKHHIPLPPSGFWSDLTAGLTPKITPLPKFQRSQLISISTKHNFIENESKKKLLEIKKSTIDSININIPIVLINPHKFTKNTEQYLFKLIKRATAINQQTTIPNDYLTTVSSIDRGRFVCHQPNCFSLAVSEPLLMRGLIFLDVLAKELENRGFKIKYLENEKPSKAIVASKEGENISFQLSEGYKYQPNKRVPKTKLDSILYPDREPVPTGKLTFIINERMTGIGRSWADGKALIETRLPEIIHEFICLIPIQKQLAIDKVLREEERHEQAMQYQKVQAIRFHEKSLFEEAFREAQSYQDLQALRTYLNDLEKAINKVGEIKNEGALSWFSTVRRLIESQDPFNKRIDFLKNL